MDSNQVKRFDYAMGHDIGRFRPVNEDAIFAFSAQVMRMDTLTPVGLFIIADGMGGHSSGERASARAISEFTGDFFRTVYPKAIDAGGGSSDPGEEMARCLERTNATIYADIPNSGTTFSALLLIGNAYWIVHVGDSRIYYFSENQDEAQLTKDHSLVQMMIDLGEITEEEGKTHIRRNVILRSVGFESSVQPDIYQGTFEAGDRFLLCCDGVWSVVGTEAWEEILRSSEPIQDQARRLVEAANEAGGPDNISCILVQCG